MRESPRTDLNDTKSSLSQSPITGRQNRSNSVSGRQKRTTKRSPIDLFKYTTKELLSSLSLLIFTFQNNNNNNNNPF
jgi:hypothetical protein